MLNNIKKSILKANEKAWQKKLRQRNKNKNPTIFCNNCLAGIIYHSLGLKFCSPTINLFFKSDEYIAFLKDLDYYLSCPMTEIKEDSKNYPIGLLEGDENHIPVRLYFQHYDTFENAKNKWYERCSRVNKDNCFAIYEYYDNLYSYESLEEFDSLKMKKVALTHKPMPEIKCSFPLTCYKDNLPVAQSTKYDGLSGKRYVDEFDYVAFLNK